jgi:hypothetical protein
VIAEERIIREGGNRLPSPDMANAGKIPENMYLYRYIYY